MGPNKAPGPDGLTARFFTWDWDFVGSRVVKIISEFFESESLPNSLNDTLIVLNPKKEKPSQTTHFPPISLCNVFYKIISSILV